MKDDGNYENLQEAARDYLEKGWCPIPIPKGKKNPILDEWQKLRIVEAEIPEHFSDDPNIGLVLGEASGGLTDVDLDCPEAIKLAPGFLPNTSMVHGRPGNPRSHFWYVCPNPKKLKQYECPISNSMLLEIRCNNVQTMVPPSIHPSGEKIAWDSFGDATRIDYDELETACTKLAVSALLLKVWPREPGIRQEIALALAGGLLRLGWIQEEVEKLIWEVAKLAGDKEAEKRKTAVKNTHRRLENDEPATGWPKLAELLDERIVNQIKKWLGAKEKQDFSELLEGLSPEIDPEELTRKLKDWIPVLAEMGELDLANAYEKLRPIIPKSFLPALKKEVKEARDRKRPEKIDELNDLVEHFPLHGALDFKEGGISLGFRIPQNGSNPLLFIVNDHRGLRVLIDQQEVEIGSERFFVSENAHPPFLREVWDLERLKAFKDDPNPPENLFSDLVQVFKKYIELAEPAYGLLAAWTVGTYFSPMFTAYPFLNLYGPKETGKSNLLRVLECLGFNAWKGRDISVAALGDTVDGMRGTVLIDQAESLKPDMTGILADSYKRAGGKRRLVDTFGGRRVLEFSTYGPKAFAATKDLDPDLRDRCIRIQMVRTIKRLPDIEGYEREWPNLKDALYRFTLLCFKDVEKHYLNNQESGSRIKEIWRPLDAVLRALKVNEDQMGQIKQFFLEATSETQHELDNWESCFFDILKDHAKQNLNIFSLTSVAISSEMILELKLEEAERKPSEKWVGDRIKKFSLSNNQPTRPRLNGKRVTEYQFNSEHVLKLHSIYMRETSTS